MKKGEALLLLILLQKKSDGLQIRWMTDTVNDWRKLPLKVYWKRGY